jgi:hypothetical protein
MESGGIRTRNGSEPDGKRSRIISLRALAAERNVEAPRFGPIGFSDLTLLSEKRWSRRFFFSRGERVGSGA